MPSTRRATRGTPPKPQTMDVDLLWRLERLGAPSLSPDGAQAVASVTRYAMDDNKASSQLWLLSTLGGAPRALTQCGEKDGQPRWSPKGDLIAFLARREQQGIKDDETQLYVIPPDGGEARRAAEVATGVDAFKWAPDGRRLLFISWVWPELQGAKAQAEKLKAFKARKETGYVTSESQYRHWDRNLPMGRVAHLHLLTLGKDGQAGVVRDLFEGSGYELGRADPSANDFDVSPDGKRVVFAFDPATEKRGDGRFALAEMDLQTRRVTVIARDADWDFSAPRYSPEGDRIAFLASHQAVRHTMPTQLALWTRDAGHGGKAPRRGAPGAWTVLSAHWDRAVHAPLTWAPAGDGVYFPAEEHGRNHLWRWSLADAEATLAVRGGWLGGYDLVAGAPEGDGTAAGPVIVTLADSVMHPAQIHVHGLHEAPLRLEHFNDALLQNVSLGRAEEVWIDGAAPQPGAERDRVQMWVVYPPDFDAKKKHPVMHCIHGGPHTGPGDNWHYRWNMHVFAAQGYVVASVNYHGSSGFGHAFLDSITHRWGELELQDVEAGTDWLLKHRWADKKRVFATGGSYGGFMVAWMNGHVAPGRYQAYVCHAGCFDWVAMFSDDAYTWHAKELGSWYWDDMARVHRQSPHAHAAAMQTPTLVIHGALDYRVPDQQGLAYYNTLKARGVDARLLWFPDENHWILKPRNSRLWHEEFFAWLRRHDPAAKATAEGHRKATRRS